MLPIFSDHIPGEFHNCDLQRHKCVLSGAYQVCVSISVKDISAPNYGHMDFPAKHPNSGQLVTPDKVI